MSVKGCNLLRDAIICHRDCAYEHVHNQAQQEFAIFTLTINYLEKNNHNIFCLT